VGRMRRLEPPVTLVYRGVKLVAGARFELTTFRL
jgi:hypothetical protein